MNVDGLASPKRLAIVGCGSSGLITLKCARNVLPDWEIVAFESSDSIKGCWGRPYRGFVSTSTKFTTQFACYPKFEANRKSESSTLKDDFFTEGEYGEYLEEFADRFDLHPNVRLNSKVKIARRLDQGGWEVEYSLNGESFYTERFDVVVICTGLAATPKLVATEIAERVPQRYGKELNDAIDRDEVNGQTVIVIGGGESAVDIAHRLAKPELSNRVLLSLKSGIRVSPRYHPVRGVPSDFLRNRLMLSADPDVRNFLGQIFVEARIRFESTFRWLFPSKSKRDSQQSDTHRLEKEWAFRLTRAAKDDLFNMFHNKSDDFLKAVGKGHIEIVGPPADDNFEEFHAFYEPDGEPVKVTPDFVVPAIGFKSTLNRATMPKVDLSEFYLGCCHEAFDDLFAIGFARPIIGNIPTISEMQAQFVSGMIAGAIDRPKNILQLNQDARQKLSRRHHWLDQTNVYPVEMFPYCDRLAKFSLLNYRPSIFKFRKWLTFWLQPATTLQYFPSNEAACSLTSKTSIFMPPLLILLIILIKPFDWAYRMLTWKRS